MAQASDDGSARSCAAISASESAVRPDWANPATWRGVMAAVIGCLTLLNNRYTLNNIKSKTVGDGQHGTARWATDAEIRKA